MTVYQQWIREPRYWTTQSPSLFNPHSWRAGTFWIPIYHFRSIWLLHTYDVTLCLDFCYVKLTETQRKIFLMSEVKQPIFDVVMLVLAMAIMDGHLEVTFALWKIFSGPVYPHRAVP